MKKIIGIFSFIMFISLFFINYSNYMNDNYKKLITLSSMFNYQMEIPNDIINANPIYLETLKQTANDHNINIARTISYYNNEVKESVTEVYIYLTSDTRLFRRINLSKGSFLTVEDMKNTQLFLSTINTKSNNQIGKISDFGGGHNFSIYILDNLITQYKYPGIYMLECASQEVYQDFIRDYAKKINMLTESEYEESDYTNISVVNEARIDGSIDIIAISLFFLFVITFTFIFYLITQTKAISVMKLNGYSTIETYLMIFVIYFIKVFIINNIILLPVMFFIPDNNFDFVIQVFMTNTLVFLAILLILTFFSALYIKSIKTTYCIKGKKPLTAIVIINESLKILVTIIVISLSVNLLKDLQIIKQKQNSYHNWTISSEYGIFYPVSTGNDSSAIRAGEYPLDLPTYDLYPILNREYNAIYINSDMYTTDSILNSSEGSIRYIIVNPNYLKEFPIYDEGGNQILIDEETDYTVYLVPEQYKYLEKYNYDDFIKARQQFYDLHSNFYHLTDKQNSKKIVFIYTKSNQEIFSINSDVFPDNENRIPDPIIQVMTEGNCLVPDTFYSSTSNQTIFIKLINTDTEITYSKLLPVLKEYGLDDNFPYLVRSNDLILKEIATLQEEANVSRFILGCLSVILLFTIIQSIYLLFQKNRYEYFLKKTLGHSYIQKYKNIFVLLLIINLIEIIVCFLLLRDFGTIFLLKTTIEIILANLIVLYFERYSTLQILKEGL